MSLQKVFENVRKASRQLNLISEDTINRILTEVAEAAVQNTSAILEENQKDLARMNDSDPKYDRLKLSPERLKDIASDIHSVVKLASPLGKILSKKQLDNGLLLKKISVPLGVIGIIYEARPNVTFDVFSLALKSGNALVLKGGSDAKDSNTIIVNIIHQVLQKNNVDENIIQLLPPNREATAELLNAVGYVDIIIPRGSQGLINYVRENAKVPVIETGAGIVHTYYDEHADLKKGVEIIANAKTRRVSVCNALDCLVINELRLSDLEKISKPLAEEDVEIFADEPSYEILKEVYPQDKLFKASEEHFGTEFLALKMSVKTVKNIDEALEHISKYSSKHSEAIISEDEDNLNYFLKAVDAAAVYANASTAFTDGSQFGLGAEIGISTQKLHARGPMALEELTSYKWIVKGQGQIRK